MSMLTLQASMSPRQMKSLSNCRSLTKDLGTPDSPTLAPVFLTNAISGIIDTQAKGGNRIRKALLQEHAREFLKPLIDIIEPAIIIAMGKEALIATSKALGFAAPKRLALLESPFQVGDQLVFAVHHCGAMGLINRTFALQRSDWKKIETGLLVVRRTSQ
jgi:hypothetical protein